MRGGCYAEVVGFDDGVEGECAAGLELAVAAVAAVRYQRCGEEGVGYGFADAVAGEGSEILVVGRSHLELRDVKKSRLW